MTEETITLQDAVQIGVNLKSDITDLYNQLAELAVLFADGENGGKLGSELRCSTSFVNTLAAGYCEFGPEYLNAESDPVLWKLDDWLRAILKTDNPHHWLEQARTRQLNAAQIRAEAGVKQERKPPWYDGGATVEAMGGGNLLFSPDMEIELAGRKRVQARIREVEE